jgi:hypothetical protein
MRRSVTSSVALSCNYASVEMQGTMVIHSTEGREPMWDPRLKAQVSLNDMLKLWEATNISGDTTLRAMIDTTMVKPTVNELLLRLRRATATLLADVDANKNETTEPSRWRGIHHLLKECAQSAQPPSTVLKEDQKE